MTKHPARRSESSPVPEGYEQILGDLSTLLEQARRTAVRTVNAVMTATYWLIGRRIVEFEQAGEERAAYGTALLQRLSSDLSCRFGRGFSVDNLENMRRFYLAYSTAISETASRICDQEPISETVSGISLTSSAGLPGAALQVLSARLALPWSHYVLLLKVEKPEARQFYEHEAIKGGWSVRQLDRQIACSFYERTLLSKDKAAMLRKGRKPKPGETLTPEQAIKDPHVLEFLDLKDEYSESDLEDALIRHLEHFLLELGSDFAFVGRQRRLRIGDEWFESNQERPRRGRPYPRQRVAGDIAKTILIAQ